MFTINPFAELTPVFSAGVMQAYVIIMILLVAGGTIFDVVHKRSARYFAGVQATSKASGTRNVGGGEKISIAVQTVAKDVLTSGEFCNPRRRVAHLLTMYGFVLYLVMTITMVFCYPTASMATPAIIVGLWYLGALMVAVGGYWFWFFIRVDVYSEGNSPFRLVRADLFIVSILASVTFGLIWAVLQTSGGGVWASIFLGLYLLSTTVLFAGVPWSKFAHMFFKPAAAFEKRVSNANGWAHNLPTISRDDPEQQKRHSMTLLADAPMDMGLGIKREHPKHY